MKKYSVRLDPDGSWVVYSVVDDRPAVHLCHCNNEADARSVAEAMEARAAEIVEAERRAIDRVLDAEGDMLDDLSEAERRELGLHFSPV